MRNQYKVLSEKYDLVNEVTSIDAQKTTKLVQDVLKCRSREELIKTMIPYFKKYGHNFLIRKEVLYHELNKLPFPDSPSPVVDYIDPKSSASKLYWAFSGVLRYLRYMNEHGSEKHFAEYYKNYSKEMWKDWWDIYKPVLDAIDSIKQKNQETGINLDI